MDRYEIGPDGTIQNVSGGSSGRSGNSGYSGGYNYNNYNFNGNNYIRHNRGRGAKVFAIIVPLLAFIIGQIIQYGVYKSDGKVLLMDMIFASTPLWVLILSTVFGVISTIHVMVRAWKLADDYEEGWSVFYSILFSIMFLVIPCIAGYYGIIVTSAASACFIECEEEAVPWIFIITAIVFAVIGIWIGCSNSGIVGVDFNTVESFSEISEYTSNEQVALDISKLKSSDCGTIITGDECDSLIIVGKKGKIYNGLKIVTNAQSIIFKNVNIQNGYLTCNYDECTLELLGKNSIEGIHGTDGGNGKHGTDGVAPLEANNLYLKGKGTLTLIAGNGGDGENGKNGDSAFLFGNGTDGQDGGTGGDSSYAAKCSYLGENDFSGKLTLKKGTAGKGGSGGKGGAGGLFGSSGSNGWDGYNGMQREFCSGEISISEERLVYIEE